MATRTYAVDQHEARETIREALVNGQSLLSLSQTYGITREALRTYRDKVIRPTLQQQNKAQAIRAPEDRTAQINQLGADLVNRIERVTAKLEAIVDAEDSKTSAGFNRLILAVRELRGYFSLLADAKGLRTPSLTINYFSIRAAIIDATEGFPEIRERIVSALPEPTDEETA